MQLLMVAGDADRGLDKVKLNASEKLRHCSETLSLANSRVLAFVLAVIAHRASPVASKIIGQRAAGPNTMASEPVDVLQRIH